MSSPWPSEEARENFIKFIELELSIIDCAADERIDPSLLCEFDDLLKIHFPRTLTYIERVAEERMRTGASSRSLPDEIRTLAWVEARSQADDRGVARVPGAWTQKEIADDIKECFRAAVERLGI